MYQLRKGEKLEFLKSTCFLNKKLLLLQKDF